MIDLRSDTVTVPGEEMRRIMAAAPVGDDVYGEDPTVNRLEETAAGIMGKEAALFCASGTQSNLTALLSLCGRGDEYIVGQQAHTYRYEGGGAAVFGSIQPQPLECEPDGTLDLDLVDRFIKPDDFHFARTRLLCLENTNGGRVLPMDYLERAGRFSASRGLKMHLDGARIFNAAVRLGIDAGAIAQPFDTVSVCLSKGLGAPVGSVLCGSREMVTRARRWRKILGGGMRQAGILAAAGIYALTRHVDRLADDHENAARLADGLSTIDEIAIDPARVQTNIMFGSAKSGFESLVPYLKERGIIFPGSNPFRLVTHLNITGKDVETVIETVKAFYAGKPL